jgi:flagellar biosynthetic protein FlhB
MAKDRDQKTEQQTAKRRREVRKKGQVARSPTLVGWLSLLLATFLMPPVIGRLATVLSEGVRSVRVVAADPTPEVLNQQAGAIAREAFAAMIPFLVVVAIGALVGTLAQVGLVFTTDPLKPKWERLNPVAGFKRLFSVKGLWETGKQIVTMLVVLAIAVPAVVGTSRMLLGSTFGLTEAIGEVTGTALVLVRLVAVIGTLIGVADFAWARFNLLRDNKMTKQEVKQEMRESEGDPHVKAKLRSTRMAMSRNRMLAGVADAHVVVTNPTHFAVALRYDPQKGAPRVVAKGSDSMAARIRAAAAEADVAVVRSAPLARALHRSCRIDDEIPRELFQAVATVLAFVRRLEGRSLLGGSVSLAVPDTWTAPGEDPEHSLERAWLRRRRARSLIRRAPTPIHP